MTEREDGQIVALTANAAPQAVPGVNAFTKEQKNIPMSRKSKAMIALAVIAIICLYVKFDHDEFQISICSYIREAAVIALYVFGFSFLFIQENRWPHGHEWRKIVVAFFVLLCIYLGAELRSKQIESKQADERIKRIQAHQGPVI